MAGLPHLMMGPPPRRATALREMAQGSRRLEASTSRSCYQRPPAKSDEQPHPVEPISASPFEATDSGEAAGAERAGEGGATEGGAAEGGATEAYGDFGDFEDEDAEAEAELQREIERAKAEREAARSGDAAASVPSRLLPHRR